MIPSQAAIVVQSALTVRTIAKTSLSPDACPVDRNPDPLSLSPCARVQVVKGHCLTGNFTISITPVPGAPGC